MKRYLRFIVVPMVALFVFASIHMGKQTAQYQEYDIQHSKMDKVMRWLSGRDPSYAHLQMPSLPNIGPNGACAAANDTSGPSQFGNGVANGCSTAVTMASGYQLATMPCLINYHFCGAAPVGAAVTPGINGPLSVNCRVTQIATQLATQSVATATVAQFEIIAPTSIASSTMLIYGIQ